MFGYVRIFEPELKVREYQLYRGVYCGLCRTMKKRTCRSSTLSLSYDFTFLAFFRAAITDELFSLTKERCGLHPFKKRYISKENEALRYCAGASAVLKYYKLLDDINDNDKRGLKRFLIRVMLPFAKKHLKRAIRSFPSYDLELLSEKVFSSLNTLSELENTQSVSPDACADAFGHTLSIVFAHGLTEQQQIEKAEKIGYHIGKWIYFADAVNDFKDDISSGSFNPFISAGYELLPVPLISNCMTMELGMTFDEFNKMSIKYSDIQDILYNIITLGMPQRAKKIFEKHHSTER